MDNKKAIAIISFGTTYSMGRKSILAVEREIKEYFKDYNIVSAYTSSIVRKKLLEYNILVDSPNECFEKLYKNGTSEVIVLATHLLGGEEYSKLMDSVKEYSSRFDNIKICRPLIESTNISKIVDTILEVFNIPSNEFLVFMGHGSSTQSNSVYHLINKELLKRNINNMYVATVEATPEINHALNMVKQYNPNKVILTPLMLVSGDHANNDMNIDWKSTFEDSNYNVECILKGIGEYSQFRKLYIDRVKEVLC